MKTFTTTLLLCAGLAVAGAAQAQTAAPTAQYKRDLYGDWRVGYPAPTAKTSAQVAAELAQAKANGTYSFGQEDYPPPRRVHPIRKPRPGRAGIAAGPGPRPDGVRPGRLPARRHGPQRHVRYPLTRGTLGEYQGRTICRPCQRFMLNRHTMPAHPPSSP